MSIGIRLYRRSAWTFETFGSGGLSLAFAAGTGGEVILRDPEGQSHTFIYGGGGVGASLGFKLPKIGKVQIQTRKGPLTGSAGPTAFPSTGALYMTDNFDGEELSIADIRGPCAFVEVGGGIVVGASAIAMLLDLDLTWAAPWSAKPFLQSASALLLMSGVNAGLQAQFGGTAYLGGLG